LDVSQFLILFKLILISILTSFFNGLCPLYDNRQRIEIMLGRENGNSCGDHPTGIIGTGYRLHRAHAHVCVGDRVDMREAVRKMIMLYFSLFSSSFSFLFLSPSKETSRLILSPPHSLSLSLSLSLSFSLSLFREKEGEFLCHTINNLIRSVSFQLVS